MVRRALRLAAGTASLAAGTWLLRALHGTPAALGADAASIRAVSEQSPNYRDGAFVNLDPASMFTLDREELRTHRVGVSGQTQCEPAGGADPVGLAEYLPG